MGALLIPIAAGARGALVRSLEETRDGVREARPRLGEVEQRQAGAELERIERAEHLFGGAAAGPGQDGVGASAQAAAKQRMVEKGAGFAERGNTIVLSGGTLAEAGQLGENEPHPVALLCAGAELGERGGEGAVLGVDEALEIEGIHAGIMDRKAAGGKGRWRLAGGRQQPGKHVE